MTSAVQLCAHIAGTTPRGVSLESRANATVFIYEREEHELERKADFEVWIIDVRDVGCAIAADCEQCAGIRSSLRSAELDRLNT